MSPKLIQALKLLAAAIVGAVGAIAVEPEPVELVAVACPPCPVAAPVVVPVVTPTEALPTP